MVPTIPQTRGTPRVRSKEADASDFVSLYGQASRERGPDMEAVYSYELYNVSISSCTTCRSDNHSP